MTCSELPVVRRASRGLRRVAGALAMVPAGPAPAGDGPGGLGADRTATPAGLGIGAPGGDERQQVAPAPSPATGAESERIEALVTLAQGGDAEAFGMLYEHYVGSVYWYVFGRVGHHALAEDLTAETFVRGLRRLDTFSWQGRDIAAWFVTIARNLVTDHHRSSRYRLETTTDDLLLLERHGSVVGTGLPAAGPEDEAMRTARDRDLLAAVRRLRPDQQECIVLRFFHDFTIAQTALVMGRSEGAVKQLQLRAVRTLSRTVEAPT